MAGALQGNTNRAAGRASPLAGVAGHEPVESTVPAAWSDRRPHPRKSHKKARQMLAGSGKIFAGEAAGISSCPVS